MLVRVGWTTFAFVVATFVSIGLSSPTSAAVPQDACKAEPKIESAEITVAPHVKQQQKGWQREGRDLDIAIGSAELKANQQAIVCFRWMIADAKAEGAKEFLDTWLQSPTIASLDPKPSTPVKFTATLPALIQKQQPPPRPDLAARGRVTGVYDPNNSFALAEVRVLVFDSSNNPVTGFRSSIGVVSSDNYCDIPGFDTTTDSGVAGLLHKNWQPIGGQFDLTVTSSKAIPNDALIKVCFRWRVSNQGGDPGRFFDSGNVHLLEAVKDRTLKIAATVPEIRCRPSSFETAPPNSDCPTSKRIPDYAVAGIAVPRADARILVFDVDDSPIVNIITTVGITQFWFALVVVAVVVVSIFAILWWICRNRLADISKSKPLLCVVTTRRGFASLSQFQIVLWTLMVLASVVYVMALSGDLIEITTGTLVLLGISGGATIAAKIKSESDDAKPTTVPDSVSAAEEVGIAQYEVDRYREQLAGATTEDALKDARGALQEAEAKLEQAKALAALADATAAAVKARVALTSAADDAAKAAALRDARSADDVVLQKKQDLALAATKAAKVARIRHPRWSDLVMEEVHGRELDVTRVQMLCFTLVTATFVGLSVATNFVIPEIPNGYLVLMGISNGVYVSSKYAVKN